MQGTPDILRRILSRKTEEISERKQVLPESELVEMCKDSPPARGFEMALQGTISQGKPAIIAEIKKASPSKGVIRKDFDPVAIAKSYADAGATCLSVLTDRDFFQGDDEYLKSARAACELPVLRKDFMIDPYQIYESRLLGSDCILLIVSAVDDQKLRTLADLSTMLGMDVLPEVHDREELERALVLRLPLIGINNRNLRTFETDINTTIGLLPDVFHDRIVITESGIRNKDDVALMRKHNVNAFLIGETFMTASDPGEKLKTLFK
ncbi:MAG: indole-3-glycerol phosphate synthase TrpC [Gammaproteobacteria bacterium]|nr:indole-3-glycerol phosphate synthase TrpC [Gammaproteobacteria bacterium]NIQ12332.1 indole-3-glycerol phosphate synthase TrpC [Gammaproteobacteria bacterium]NIQ75171.1 indole-3-glycerol phosphate synthase TrpC [Gammaproteobacteria bacterium]NIR26202.1 indole-3-glycerol phosphate synthase TrpC [Gammaproteobacteria bacterium]NIR96028.1 indole-3-glycerol phosphate synthase TrpC [Gammaproteobacteria bacterium]